MGASSQVHAPGSLLWINLKNVLFTQNITPWSRVLLEELTVTQLVKKFPAFYGTRKFISFHKCPPLVHINTWQYTCVVYRVNAKRYQMTKLPFKWSEVQSIWLNKTCGVYTRTWRHWWELSIELSFEKRLNMTWTRINSANPRSSQNMIQRTGKNLMRGNPQVVTAHGIMW